MVSGLCSFTSFSTRSKKYVGDLPDLASTLTLAPLSEMRCVSCAPKAPASVCESPSTSTDLPLPNGDDAAGRAAPASATPVAGVLPAGGPDEGP